MDYKTKISSAKTLYVLVGITILFFIIKGATYAFIGSYIPLLFIIFWLLLICWSFGKKNKTHLRILKYWIILVLIWTLIRIGIGIILQIDSNLTESHLREQFGFIQNIITLVMLFISIKAIKHINKEKSKLNKNGYI